MNLSYNIFGLDKITRSFGMEITEEYFEKIFFRNVYFKNCIFQKYGDSIENNIEQIIPV